MCNAMPSHIASDKQRYRLQSNLACFSTIGEFSHRSILMVSSKSERVWLSWLLDHEVFPSTHCATSHTWHNTLMQRSIILNQESMRQYRAGLPIRLVRCVYWWWLCQRLRIPLGHPHDIRYGNEAIFPVGRNAAMPSLIAEVSTLWRNSCQASATNGD